MYTSTVRLIAVMIVLLGTLCIAHQAIAQTSNGSIGHPSDDQFQKATNGNSNGIAYDINQVLYKGQPLTYWHTISADSDTNELLIYESSTAAEPVQPFSIGPALPPGQAPPSGATPLSVQAVDFSYSALFEQRTDAFQWAFNFDWDGFSVLLDSLGNQAGLRIEDIDAYGESIYRYAGTWTGDGQGWAWGANHSNSGSFVDLLNSWPNDNYRVTDLEIHQVPDQTTLLFHAVAIGDADTKGFAWIFGADQSAFFDWADDQLNTQGRVIIDLEVYRIPGTSVLRFGGVAVNEDQLNWILVNADWNTFLEQHNTIIDAGGRLVDYEVLTRSANGTVQVTYAGAWIDDGTGWAFALNFNQEDFLTQLDENIADGFLPIMINVYDADAIAILTANEPDEVVDGYELRQNYPNPFNPSTTITYSIPRAGQVTLKVFNALGTEVATLIEGPLPSGAHQVVFNAQNLSSGIYFYRLQSGEFTQTRPLILMK